jgi:hypothetical protein
MGSLGYSRGGFGVLRCQVWGRLLRVRGQCTKRRQGGEIPLSLSLNDAMGRRCEKERWAKVGRRRGGVGGGAQQNRGVMYRASRSETGIATSA